MLLFFTMCGSKRRFLGGFWTAGRTKEAIRRCHFGLWEVVMSILHYVSSRNESINCKNIIGSQIESLNGCFNLSCVVWFLWMSTVRHCGLTSACLSHCSRIILKPPVTAVGGTRKKPQHSSTEWHETDFEMGGETPHARTAIDSQTNKRLWGNSMCVTSLCL